MKMIKTFLLLCCIIMVTSCNEFVELCYSNHPHRAYVDFQFDWSEKYLNVPDSMHVLAYRRIKDLRYEMMVTSKEKGNTGIIIHPEEEIDTIGQNGGSKIWLHNGHYEIFAYNGVTDEFLEQLNVYYSLDYSGPDDIVLVYKPYRYVDQNKRLARYISWVDANTYSEFVLNGDMPVYYANGEVDVPVEDDIPSVECKLQPSKIRSQIVNVNFNINPKEDGIVIDSIHAEMSGICSTITLGTGICNTEKTYKTLFSPECPSTAEYASPLQVHGSFITTGIVRAINNTTLIGPGIMQLNVYARISEEGRTVRKMYRASINLYNTLSMTPSLRYVYEKDAFMQSAPSITLNIEDVLSITREGIMESVNSNMDCWKDGGSIYLEI